MTSTSVNAATTRIRQCRLRMAAFLRRDMDTVIPLTRAASHVAYCLVCNIRAERPRFCAIPMGAEDCEAASSTFIMASDDLPPRERIHYVPEGGDASVAGCVNLRSESERLWSPLLPILRRSRDDRRPQGCRPAFIPKRREALHAVGFLPPLAGTDILTRITCAAGRCIAFARQGRCRSGACVRLLREPLNG